MRSRSQIVTWFWLAALVICPAAGLVSSSAQTPGNLTAASSASEPDILDYIRTSWDRLSRSMSDCNSLADPKIPNGPVLYLPFGMADPSALVELQRKCHIQVRHLPRAITQLGAVRPSELGDEGLLYLPNKYVVPGGRFNEMYGWDSYFILLGLVADGRDDLARGMVENFFFEIENYGALLNANRTYFLTRSQPPLLSSMIREVWEHNAAGPTGTRLTQEWLAHAYRMAVQDHALWTSAVHQAGATGLARYDDVGAGPVPEMADDSTYYPDVIRYLLSHPGPGQEYLLAAPDQPSPAEQQQLARDSCDVSVSRVCAHAYADGHRLTAAFFQGDRAMRESGFDTSFRFGPFSGSAENYAPVCLNSLLFKYEMDLAHFADLLGKADEAARWRAVADARHKAVDRYLWNEQTGLYFDYDFATGQQSSYKYISAFYPLWAGLASPAQAKRLVQEVKNFEHAGGLATSTESSGTQWDLPFGWAPTNWFTISGLDAYGFHADAQRLAQEFSSTIAENFSRDHTLREKYNVVSGSANVAVAAGYKANNIGFGWTNGVYLRLQTLLHDGAVATKAHAGD